MESQHIPTTSELQRSVYFTEAVSLSHKVNNLKGIFQNEGNLASRGEVLHWVEESKKAVKDIEAFTEKIANHYMVDHNALHRDSVTLTELKRAATHARLNNLDDFLIIKVQGATAEPEIIINPKVNIEEKVNYYMKAYDEDFSLKVNPSIWVSGFAFVQKEDLARYLQ